MGSFCSQRILRKSLHTQLLRMATSRPLDLRTALESLKDPTGPPAVSRLFSGSAFGGQKNGQKVVKNTWV